MNNKLQTFPYSFKSVSASTVFACGNGLALVSHMPEELHQVKSLWTHIRLYFDRRESALAKTLDTIYVANSVNPGLGGLAEGDGNDWRMLTIAKQADDDGLLDLKLDLTPYLYPNGDNYLTFFLGAPLAGLYNNRLLLWKIDTLYTTIGIR